MIGGAGNDIFYASYGNDIMTGGEGADTFIFGDNFGIKVSSSDFETFEYDFKDFDTDTTTTILDFIRGEDIIDLTPLLYNKGNNTRYDPLDPSRNITIIDSENGNDAIITVDTRYLGVDPSTTKQTIILTGHAGIDLATIMLEHSIIM